jgi:hypothetical protein
VFWAAVVGFIPENKTHCHEYNRKCLSASVPKIDILFHNKSILCEFAIQQIVYRFFVMFAPLLISVFFLCFFDFLSFFVPPAFLSIFLSTF